LVRKATPHTIPLLISIDETFDLGATPSAVVNDIYEMPFRFTSLSLPWEDHSLRGRGTTARSPAEGERSAGDPSQIAADPVYPNLK